MKAAVGIFLLTATLAAPAAANIRVWSERDRQGEGKEIRRSVRDLKNYRLDDQISSLEADEPWEVCSEPLYRGDCRIVQGVVLNLRPLGMNNRITSMRKASEELITERSNQLDRPRPAPPKTETSKASSTARTTPNPKSQSPQPTRTKAEEVAKTEPPRTAPPKAEEVAKTEPPRTAPPKAEEVAKAEPPASAPPKAEEAAKAESPRPAPPEAADEDATAWRNPTPKTDAEPPKSTSRSKRAAPPPAAPAPAAREWWEGADDNASGPPQLELFEKPNYEGRRLRLEQAISDLTALDQPVGSLLVRSGSWQICSKPQFRGRCRTVDTNSLGVPETPLIGSLRPEPD